MKHFFKTLWAMLVLEFGKHLPKNWETTTESVINFLQAAKTAEATPGASIIAMLLQKIGGNIILAEIQKITNELLITSQIAYGAEKATEGITDPVLKADAIMTFILANLKSLPVEWQGSHVENIAAILLKAILNITTTQAKSLINTKYGEMFKTEVTPAGSF